ncbi:MAG: hypothetical protein U0610_07220 [bacterium]
MKIFVAILGLILCTACEPGQPSAGIRIPFATGIAFPAEPLGRGLANPKEVIASADGRIVWVLERGAGRLARIEVATGTLTRHRAPDGRPITHLRASEDRSTLLAVSGVPAGDPSGAYTSFGASPATIWRVDAASGELTRVSDVASVAGFFLALDGSTYLDTSRGIERVAIATGARETLQACDGAIAELVDPSGRFVAWHTTHDPVGIHDSTYEELRVCDRATGTTRTTGVPARELLSFACGGRWLVRPATGFPADSPIEPHRYALFDVYDPATLERVASYSTATPPAFTGPMGPVTTDAACERAWFAVPTAVVEYALATRTLTSLGTAAGPIGGVLARDTPSSLLVTTDEDVGVGVEVLDLSTAELQPAWSRHSFGTPNGMAWRSDERELVLGFSAHYQDLYPVEIYDWSEIQRYAPLTDELVTGDSTRDTVIGGLAACDASGELLAWTKLTDGETPELAHVEGTTLVRDRAGPVRTAAEDVGIPAPLVGQGIPMVASADCRSVYFLNGEVVRLDRARNVLHSLAAAGVVDAMALDPRQDALLLQDGDDLAALDLVSGERWPIATGVPRSRALFVTPEGQLVLVGDEELAIGVIDLVSGDARRVWEGHGKLGRWYRDFDVFP